MVRSKGLQVLVCLGLALAGCGPPLNATETLRSEADLTPPEQFTFIFEDGIKPNQEKALIYGARLVTDHFASLGLTFEDVTIYAFSDAGDFADEYLKHDPDIDRDQVARGMESLGGVSFKGTVIVFVPKLSKAAQLRQLVIHELTHVMQISFVGSIDTEIDPVWIVEGGATFTSSLVAASNRLAPDSVMDVALGAGSPLPGSVPALVSLEREYTNDAYRTGAWAIKALADLSGEDALYRYWQYRGNGMIWREAFFNTFGVCVEDFYQAFDAGLTPVPGGAREACDFDPEARMFSFRSTGPVIAPDGSGVDISSWLSLDIDASICPRSAETDLPSLLCVGAANFDGPLEEVIYIFMINGIELPEIVEAGQYMVESNCGPGLFQQLTDNIFMLNFFGLQPTCSLRVEMDGGEVLSSEISFIDR